MNINPSISKNRVKEEVVLSINWELPDAAGNVVINVATTIDPSSNNLLSSSVDGLYVDKRASQHSFVPSQWTATTVQWAIDETMTLAQKTDSNLITTNSNVTNLQTDITTLNNTKLETVSDSNSIDLTKSGVNVSAALKLDASTNNLLSVSWAGTFADERASAHTYSNTISWINAINVQNALDEILSLNRSDNVTITRDINNQVIQIVDVTNSQTWNIDWTDFNNLPAKLYIQRLGDTKIYTITYSINGYPDSIIYA